MEAEFLGMGWLLLDRLVHVGVSVMVTVLERSLGKYSS